MFEEKPITNITLEHKRHWMLISLGLLIIFVDQITKAWVEHYLPVIHSSIYWYPYSGIGIFKNFLGVEFSINHATNTGAAWGILGNFQLPLVLLRMGLISGLCIYLFRINHQRHLQIPLLLITAGAIGNVLDYFIYGHVIDMFHFVFGRYDFPIFNVADSAITIGIIWLFICYWKTVK